MLLKPFEELKTDKQDLDHMNKIEIILPPHVLSSKTHILPRVITRSMCSKFEEDNKVNSIPQENIIGFGFEYIYKDKFVELCGYKGNVVITSDATHKTVRNSDMK